VPRDVGNWRELLMDNVAGVGQVNASVFFDESQVVHWTFMKNAVAFS
jgi:hypothetical protein